MHTPNTVPESHPSARGTTRRTLLIGVIIIVSIVAIGLLSLQVFAATFVWTGGGASNDWSDPANWSTNSVPTAGDYVVFNGTSSKDVHINVPIDVGGIDLSTGFAGRILQQANIPLTVSPYGFSIRSGSFVGSNADITINGNVRITGGSFTTTTGTLHVTSDWTVNGGTFDANGGTVSFDGSPAKNVHTLSGSTVFHSLSLRSSGTGSELLLPAGNDEEQRVNGSLTLHGQPNAPLLLAAHPAGSMPALMNINGTTDLQYVLVRSIRNTNERIASCQTGCIDGGSNVLWNLPRPSLTYLGEYGAGNIDGSATQQGSIAMRTDIVWEDPNRPGSGALLHNFSLPSTRDSGWQGTGTPPDPYRLRFDGIDDYVRIGRIGNLRSISLWFKADTVLTGGKTRFLLKGGLKSEVFLKDGVLTVNANNGVYLPYQSTAVASETWYHLLLTNDGKVSRYYLNGTLFAQNDGSIQSKVDYYLGAESPTRNHFDGSIASLRVLDSALTPAQVLQIHEDERTLYSITPTEHFSVTPSVTGIDGGRSIVIQGSSLSSVTDVTINGVSTNFVNNGPMQITFAAPPAKAVDTTAGSFAPIQITTDGTVRTVGSLLYTTTAWEGVSAWFDARHVTKADAWTSLAQGREAALINITHPATATSGWQGTGTPADPHRLHLDGVDDFVHIGHNFLYPRSLTQSITTRFLWFQTDSVDTGGREQSILSASLNDAVSLKDGVLTLSYSFGGYVPNQSTAIEPNRWYHLAYTNDGRESRYYLNGTLFARNPGAVNGNGDYYVGRSSVSNSGFFRGAIASIRLQDGSLTAEQILHIYEEERGIYQPHPSTETAVVPSVAGMEGGMDMVIRGEDLSNVTNVSINGIETDFTIDGPTRIAFIAPAATDIAADAGSFATVQITSDDTVRTAGTILYTATEWQHSPAWFDARHATAAGEPGGSGSTMGTWTSLESGRQAKLMNFSGSATPESGWQGTGTPVNPYRLQLDGINDYVHIGYNWLYKRGLWGRSNSYSLWFRADTVESGGKKQYIVAGGAYNNQAFIQDGLLTVSYTFGGYVPFQSTAILPDRWYNLIYTSDMTESRYYLNGTLFARNPGITNELNDLFLGTRTGKDGFFDGAIASFRASNMPLTPAQALQLYEEERGLYAATVDENGTIISPSVTGMDGGQNIVIRAEDLSRVTTVTINDVSTDFTVDGSTQITFTTPSATHASADAGSFAPVQITAGGTVRTVGSILYTDTPFEASPAWFDARRATGSGTGGSGSTTQTWISLESNRKAALMNFSHPATAESGWQGTTTPSDCDPSRLRFDGSNDYVHVGHHWLYNHGIWGRPNTYAVWFQADTITTGRSPRYIVYGSLNNEVFIQDGVLTVGYTFGGYLARHSTPIQPGRWYHLLYTNDGKTSRYYLNGVTFATNSNGVTNPLNNYYIGTRSPTAGFFDGSIGSFRASNATVTAEQALQIFEEEKSVYGWEDPATSAGDIPLLICEAGADEGEGEGEGSSASSEQSSKSFSSGHAASSEQDSSEAVSSAPPLSSSAPSSPIPSSMHSSSSIPPSSVSSSLSSETASSEQSSPSSSSHSALSSSKKSSKPKKDSSSSAPLSSSDKSQKSEDTDADKDTDQDSDTKKTAPSLSSADTLSPENTSEASSTPSSLSASSDSSASSMQSDASTSSLSFEGSTSSDASSIQSAAPADASISSTAPAGLSSAAFSISSRAQFTPIPFCSRLRTQDMTVVDGFIAPTVGGELQHAGLQIVFRDTPARAWYAVPIYCIVSAGTASGYDDVEGNTLSIFRPSWLMDYAELARVSLELAGKDVRRRIGIYWYLPYFDSAQREGLSVFASPEERDPHAAPTRGEFVQTLLEAIGIPLDAPQSTYVDVPVSHPYARSIATATRLGMISGDDNARTFRPDASINRGEAAKILMIIMELDAFRDLQLRRASAQP